MKQEAGSSQSVRTRAQRKEDYKKRLTAERTVRNEALRAAMRTVIETFPDDWRRAQFEVEMERGNGEPVISIRFYQIEGDYFEQSGGEC